MPPSRFHFAASIKCKDEKVYQLLQRVFHRAHQEDDLADVVEAAKLRPPRHCHDRPPGRRALGDRFRFPISDERNLHVVILTRYGRNEMVRSTGSRRKREES